MSEKNDEVVETDPEILISQFSKKFSENYTPEEWKKIQSAWDYLISKTSDLKRKCGKPYYLHPLRVATILAEKILVRTQLSQVSSIIFLMWTMIAFLKLKRNLEKTFL